MRTRPPIPRWTAILFLFVAAMLLLASPAQAAIGELDPAFGDGGMVVTEFAGTAGASALLIQPDGKLVAAGFAGDAFALARYGANGGLDGGFGSGGKVTTAFTAAGDAAYALARQPDGKIVAAGRSGDFAFALARYNANGSLDNSFSGDGKLTTQFGEEAGAFAVGVQSDGKIVAAGYSNSGGFLAALTRYNANGTLDNTFDGDGRVTMALAGGAAIQALLLLPDGKILVAGTSSGDFLLARYNGDGSLDTSFQGARGGPGWVIVDFGGSSTARALARQADGKIVVAGSATLVTANRADFALARLNADGSLDNSFDGDGKVTTDIREHDEIYGVGIQSTGKIVVAGVTGFSENRNIVISRYSSAGSPDPTFNVPAPGAGRVTTDFGGAFDQALAVAIQPDDKIVAAGQTSAATSRFALTRYQSPLFNDVSPDQYFYTPVVYLSERGIISGYDDGTFKPFNNTTRGQLAKIVVLAEEFPLITPGSPTFLDVGTDNPFYREIETAVERGIISGYDLPGGREFRPNNNVTRGQLAKIIVTAEDWKLISPAVQTFNDVPPTNPFYREIETAVDHGIISGYDVPGGREFRWQNFATRGQIAKIVYEAITGP